VKIGLSNATGWKMNGIFGFNMRSRLAAMALALFAGLTAMGALAADLTVRVEGFKTLEGKAAIAVFSREQGFPRDDAQAVRKVMLPIDPELSATSVFTGLAPGEYAVAVFHDDNDSGKLETNLFGIPRKAYGFSNNPTSKLRMPRYDEARFTLPLAGTQIVIRLVH
jgi:uncharacterized protein (DUF2141 family)